MQLHDSCKQMKTGCFSALTGWRQRCNGAVHSREEGQCLGRHPDLKMPHPLSEVHVVPLGWAFSSLPLFACVLIHSQGRD